MEGWAVAVCEQPWRGALLCTRPCTRKPSPARQPLTILLASMRLKSRMSVISVSSVSPEQRIVLTRSHCAAQRGAVEGGGGRGVKGEARGARREGPALRAGTCNRRQRRAQTALAFTGAAAAIPTRLAPHAGTPAGRRPHLRGAQRRVCQQLAHRNHAV